MSKVPLEIVTEVLQENELPEDQVLKITRQINRRADQIAAEAEADKEPQVKKQWVIIVSDPDGEMNHLPDLVGWVAQIPENDNPGVAVDRIIKGAYDYNQSRRGRKHPAKSIGEAIEVVGSKYLKEHKVWTKTKLPVTVLKTDNVLPRDDSNKISMDDLRIRSVLP